MIQKVKVSWKVTPFSVGDVSTLAGQCGSSGNQDGDASEALFSTAIEGIACLRNCSILVTDPSSRTVRIITPDGDCPHQAGHRQHDPGVSLCLLTLCYFELLGP